MNIRRRSAKDLWIYWSMEDNQYNDQFNEIQKLFPDYKFRKLEVTESKEIELDKIFDECILVMSGSIFKKNRDAIEKNCFLYKIYIFEKMTHLYQNLPSEFPYVKTVTDDLDEIKACIEVDSVELSI